MRGRSPRPAIGSVVGVAVLLLASTVHADGEIAPLTRGDYGIANHQWNGLSDFVELAEARGYPLRVGSGLDMTKLGPDDRVILVYPTTQLDPTELASFIIDGGRVLVADDFGGSSALLHRLGIARRPMRASDHHTFHRGRPGLPIVTRGGKHPLVEGVEAVVANHPAVLSTHGGAILPYDDPAVGLVYDMRLARGKAIVIGDPSILINHMLKVGDDQRFVANALDYLCEGQDECSPYLLVGDFGISGHYASQNPDSESGLWLDTSVSSWNQTLERIASFVPPYRAIYYASLLLMGGIIIFLFTVFPVRMSAPVQPEVGPGPEIHPLSEFEWNLRRFERASPQANYALPVSILKSEFESLFYREMAQPMPSSADSTAARRAVLARAATRYAERVATDSRSERLKTTRRTLELLTLFDNLPPRHRLFLDNETSFNERDLLKIHARSLDILTRLGIVDGLEHQNRDHV